MDTLEIGRSDELYEVVFSEKGKSSRNDLARVWIETRGWLM